MLLCLGEPPRRFLWCCCSSFHFVVVSSFVDVLHFVVVLHSHFLFDVIPHPFLWLSPGFYTHFILSAQPIAEWFATLSFFDHSIIFLLRALWFWVGIFYPQAFFTLRSFPTFLAQPAFIKAFLGASSSALKFAGLHTDPQNTDPAHLFVWFTVIHNLRIQNDSVLNSTIYWHKLLVVKV